MLSTGFAPMIHTDECSACKSHELGGYDLPCLVKSFRLRIF